MKITIWDMDFYYKKSFLPNPLAMKISSYHKQQGHLINFVEEDYHIEMSYDIFYLIKNKKATPKPPRKILDDSRVRLIGKYLRFFGDLWEPSSVISAVRPDYRLYPEDPKNSYYNAHIVQFYHKGELLKKKQPFENTIGHHKKTLVIDEEFWDGTEEEILYCLNELKDFKNIAFSHPINLKRIMESGTIQQKFKELDFSQGTHFRFRNNYGHDFLAAQSIIQYIASLKEFHPNVNFGNIPFKAVFEDHWSNRDLAIKDLERCLFIMNEAKKNKIYIRLVSPRNRLESPYWYYFEILEYWSLYMPKKSYVELMLNSAMNKLNLEWFSILNNSKKWITPNTYFLLSVMNAYPNWIKKYGLRTWEEEKLNEWLIDWDSVKKHRAPWKNYIEEIGSEKNE